MSQPLAYDRQGFKVYLEGIDIPFTKVNITETEGNFPNAVIAIPATRDCTRVLPGTIVQVMGPHEQPQNKPMGDNKDIESVLLFEGEVVSLQYSKEATGRALQLQCSHFMNRMAMARSYSQDSLAPQMHKNARMIFCSAGAPVGFPGTTNKQKEDGADTDKDVRGDDGLVSEFTLANRFGGVNLSTIQMIESILPGGDINSVVQKVVGHFDLTDYYWSIMDVSYRIRSTIIAFPNKQPQALSAVLVESMKKLITSMKEGPAAQDVYSLLDVLATILDVLRYQTITPAAPTGGISSMGSSNTDSFEPLRAFVVPDLDAAPPALCNVFFPEHLVSFSYGRSFFSEPTRSISYLDWNMSNSGTTGQWGINFVIPDLKVFQVNWKPKDEDGEDGEQTMLDYSATFTPEEAYQGARPVFNPIDGWMTAAANEYYDQKDRTTENITNEDGDGPSWSKAMKNEAMKTWMLNKYGTGRNVTLQTSWNPNRICGLPGLILDPGFPSIYGVISSIQTQILADGSCSSSVAMRACRVIYDEDTEALAAEDAYLYPNASRTIDSDIFPGVHDFLYQSELYNYKEIGKAVYTYMTQGLKPTGAETALEKQIGEETWNVNKEQWASMPNANHYDYSILRKIRSSDNPDAFTLPQDADNPEDTDEQLYAKYLYLAVSNLKKEYMALSSSANAVGLRTYLTDITYRQLVPFSDYLSFIQASNTREDSDYKESVNILSSNAAENLQTLINNAASLNGKISDTIVQDTLFKKLKLDFGTGSSAYSSGWYKEEISKIEAALLELENNHENTVREQLEKIENAATQSPSGFVNYTIVTGDTLSGIASANGISIDDILANNSHPGPAIQDVDGNKIIAGKTLKLPSSPNPKLAQSVIEAKAKTKEALDTIYNTTVAELNSTLTLYKDNIALIEQGIEPSVLIANDDVRAIYRPYDATRRDHILLAFNDLLTSGTEMTITK